MSKITNYGLALLLWHEML